jgi:spermidine/putrescine transport system ATP-binding protein
MRGEVVLQGLRKAFGDVVAVADVSLDVRPGEFLTLLGPSGCGKTTLLRLLAGFESPDAGRILISGRDVTARPPHRRPVNTVFQHYALFPHRTVAGNVAFGLEMQGRGKAEIAERVEKGLDMVRLGGFGGRDVSQLSGGEQQRVALARAVVLEPEVLLLDEPMAALDLKLRQEMRVEVKNLQERLGITFVFVTHDQDEALVMSDRIAVMSHGRLEQVDAPEALYDRPRTRFVADFLAVRNLLPVTVVSVAAGRAALRTRGGVALEAADDGGYRQGDSVWIGIRPERMHLSDEADSNASERSAIHSPRGREADPPDERRRIHFAAAEDASGGSGGRAASAPQLNCLSGRLEDEIYLGDRTDWRVRVGEETVTVAEPAASARPRRRGEAVTVSFPAEAVLRLEDTGAASR